MKDLIAVHYKPNKAVYDGSFVTVVRCPECGSIGRQYEQMKSRNFCPHCGSSKVSELKNPGRYRDDKWEIFTPEKRETRRDRLRDRALASLKAVYDSKALAAFKRYCPVLEFKDKLK